MLDKGRSGNEHQAPDQVQPRGAEHGPEGQQQTEREAFAKRVRLQAEITGRKTAHLYARLLHSSKDRQKETKP